MTDHCPRCGFALKPQAERSLDQNRLQFQWFRDIARQWEGHSAIDVRRFCKYRFGVAIRCASSDAYRKAWASIERSHLYFEQLELMDWFPVTQDMTKEEMTDYLGEIDRWATEQGWELTRPDGKWWETAA